MSTIYEPAPQAVVSLGNEILCSEPVHKPLLDARVKIDYVMAFRCGEGWALKVRGLRVLGYARRIGLKDRAMGRGDCEVVLDGDWWKEAPADQAKALLDHELTHFEVIIDKRGLQRDDLGRPKLALRPHDFEVGWFHQIARRHGAASQECIQAKTVFEEAGQYYWPSIGGNPG